MTEMDEFRQAIKKLAKGEHCAVQHEIVDYMDTSKHEWRAYIDGKGWTLPCRTTEEVIAEMRERCSGSE